MEIGLKRKWAFSHFHENRKSLEIFAKLEKFNRFAQKCNATNTEDMDRIFMIFTPPSPCG
jgi:hypothetical protein